MGPVPALKKPVDLIDEEDRFLIPSLPEHAGNFPFGLADVRPEEVRPGFEQDRFPQDVPQVLDKGGLPGPGWAKQEKADRRRPPAARDQPLQVMVGIDMGEAVGRVERLTKPFPRLASSTPYGRSQ